MTTGGDNTGTRNRAIHNARLRLIELEIESHRVKAELARLEAQREDAAADRLSRHLPAVKERGVSPASWKRVVPSEAYRGPANGNDAEPELPCEPELSSQTPADRGTAAAPPKVDTDHKTSAGRKRRIRRKRKSRRTVPAWRVSLLVHLALLPALGFVTFSVLENDSILLMTSSIDDSEVAIEEPVDLQIEELELDEAELEEVALEPSPFELDAQSLSDLIDPAQKLGAEVGADLGFADMLPGDVGTLMAGPGGGEPAGGGRGGRNSFFGTPAEGKRFLFVVDNSGSMKEGRMETTFLELMNSVSSMRRDQYFFVIFYSDRAYPLFYPDPADQLVPATKENKEKLQSWLSTVELCTGGRLIEAMELAEQLRPQVVFLLSDGAYFGNRTMPYMTEEKDWPFVIHTLGMNVRNQQDAANLLAIGRAHGGTFRMVQASPVAIQMATQRPIKYNDRRGKVWGTKIRKQ